MEPVRLHWDLHSAVDLADVWRAISDTDTFNRAMGLGFDFEEKVRPDGSVMRRGRARKFGLQLQWEELPFEIRAPMGFVSRRVFAGGPLALLQTTVSLTEKQDGTSIAYTVDLTPRNRLVRPLVALDAAATTRPMLDKMLHRLLESLMGRDQLDPPPPLAAAADARLSAWASSVPRAALARVIRFAPLTVQDRIRPLQVAAFEGLEEDGVITACLDGVRAGLLELTWELICPICRGAKASAPRLGDEPTDVHCASCNIRYDGTFPESVAVTFRPSPEIRRFTVPVDCLLSPSRTPHQLAQANLRPYARIELDARLEAGGYRIDTHPSLGGATIEVREGNPDADVAVDLTDEGVRPRVLRVAPGQRRILVRSRLPSEGILRLESRWLPPYTLTAGRLIESPAARALLPADAVVPGLSAVVVRRTVVALDHTAEVPESVLARAVASSSSDRGTVLAFEQPSDAIAALRILAGLNGVSAGVAIGPVALLQDALGRTRPLGSTVDRALATLRSVGGARVGVHVSDKRAPELVDAMARAEGLQQQDPGEFCHLLLTFAVETRERKKARIRRAGGVAPPICGPFELGEEIARGAHGRVYAAIHAESGGEAVVKLLVPELLEDPLAEQRFYAEARFTSALDHPNVVRVLDWGETRDGRLWLAMERLNGEPLDIRLLRGPLSVSDTLRIGDDVLSALDAAHRAQILHRDLKPGNLFLVGDVDFQTKVLDFGIAQELGEEEDSEVVVPGTPQYMSPEQVESDPMDARSDLYSLGVVLYECLSGSLPFDGDQGYVIAMQRVLRDPKPLATVAPSVPDPVASVVMRALALDPPKRWLDASSMRAALAASRGPIKKG